MPSVEVGYAGYDRFIRNALLQQLSRVEPGKDLEEDHMRNRQLIALWAFERGARDNVIEKRRRDGKTFFVVNDHRKLRALFGALLRELQRIKSTGDYAAIRDLVERYGVKVDPELHAEVRERYARARRAGAFRIHGPAPRAGEERRENSGRAHRIPGGFRCANARVRGPLRVSPDLELNSRRRLTR